METEQRATGSLAIVRSGAAPARIPQPPPVGRRAWRQGLVLASAVVIMLALGGAWWTYFQPVAVAVEHPTRGPAIESVYATGVIEAIDYARFGATVAGRVTDVLVDEGDAVRKGDVVARLDDSQALARVRDARARLTMAEADSLRDQTLMNRGVLAVQTLERAQQERDQAAAAVELFARQLEDYTVLAPLSGTVMKRNVEPGETVAANAVLYEIASTARKRIAADADERDIAGVRLGAPIAAHADGFPDEAFVVDLSVLVVVAVISVAAMIVPVIGHGVSDCRAPGPPPTTAPTGPPTTAPATAPPTAPVTRPFSSAKAI